MIPDFYDTYEDKVYPTIQEWLDYIDAEYGFGGMGAIFPASFFTSPSPIDASAFDDYLHYLRDTLLGSDDLEFILRRAQALSYKVEADYQHYLKTLNLNVGGNVSTSTQDRVVKQVPPTDGDFSNDYNVMEEGNDASSTVATIQDVKEYANYSKSCLDWIYKRVFTPLLFKSYN